MVLPSHVRTQAPWPRSEIWDKQALFFCFPLAYGAVLFERVVKLLSLFAWNNPKVVLWAVAMVTAVFGLVATQLTIDASILGSLNDQDPQVLRLKEIRKDFPSSGAMALLIEGAEEVRLQEAAEAAAQRLGALPQVSEATARIEPSSLVAWGVMSLDDEGYRELERVLRRTLGSLQVVSDEPDLGLNALISELRRPNPFRSEQQSAVILADQLDVLAGRGDRMVARHMAGLPVRNGWFATETGDLYVVDLRTILDPIANDVGSAAFAPLAEVGAQLSQEFPDVDFVFAGMSAVAAQDQEAVLARVLPLSSVSLLIVLALLWRLNRSFSALFVVGTSLVTALIWTFGLVHLVIGYASIMVMGFAYCYLASDDHAAHLLLRMNEELRDGASDEDAVAVAWVTAGRGVVVGGGTTALAFACMCLIDFKAAVHLGATAAMGTVCALFLMMTMLPALLRVTQPYRRLPDAPPSAGVIAGVVRWSQVNRRRVLIPALILTAFGAQQCQHIELETDLEEVMTRDLPAMNANKRLKERLGVSTEAVYLRAPAELRTRAAALEALPEVARVEGLHTLLPQDAHRRMQRNQSLIPVLNDIEAALPTTLDEHAYKQGLRDAREWVSTWTERGDSWSTLGAKAMASIDALEENTGAERVDRLEQMVTDTRQAITSETGNEASIPPEILARYRSEKGYLALIYPTDDRLDAVALTAFRGAVQGVDPEAAGGLFVVDYLLVGGMERMQLALCAILVVLAGFLVVDLRRPRWIVLALVPVVCGSFAGLGVVMAIGQPMTLVMLSAFPLLFGIGIDDGVHILHRYREGGRDMPAAIAQVGQAILFTTLSTAASFAVLLGLNHNGFRGLAILVIVGVFACFLSSITVIPALVTWVGVDDDA